MQIMFINCNGLVGAVQGGTEHNRRDGIGDRTQAHGNLLRQPQHRHQG
jgi:hypothetical protein